MNLARLRVRLTIWYALASAIGLAVLAGIVVDTDSRLTFERMKSILRGPAIRADRLVAAGGVDRLSMDVALAQGRPAVFVFEKTRDGVDVRFQPARTYGDDISGVASGAALAIDAGDEINAAFDRSQFFAMPLSSSGRSAVVTVLDSAPFWATHDRLAWTVRLGALALVVLSSATGFVLAGRSVRPAMDVMRQQEQFIADAAHELRTPVASLRATVESALAGDEPADAALRRAYGTVVEAGHVIDDLLVLARMDAGRQELRKQPLRLDLLVEQIVDARADTPRVVVSTIPLVVDADTALLRRAIENLIDNAVRHGRASDPAADVRLSVRPGELVVADSGPGLEPGLEPSMFDRFRTGRHSLGAGLGLAIVRWVVERHGWNITAADRKAGSGAEFVVRLRGDRRPSSSPQPVEIER